MRKAFNNRPFGTGFSITFENGWTASVQWGSGTYSDNHSNFSPDGFRRLRLMDSDTAEVAVITPDDNLQDPEGYRTPAELLAILNDLASRPAKEATS